MNELPIFDLGSFRVVIPTAKARVMSTSEIRIYPYKLEFSFISAVEMGYPREICMLISDDVSKLLVCPMKPEMDRKQAIPFYKEETMYTKDNRKSQKAITVSNKALAAAIHEKMGWGKTTYCTPGIRYDNSMLLFDLSAAVPTTHRKTKSYMTPCDILMTYPPLGDMLNKYKAVPALPPDVSRF